MCKAKADRIEPMKTTENAPENTNNNITLIGMPGAGKSTLGVVLAKKLGYRFVDTDLLIQEGTGQLLSEIIEERGIEGFIACENELLAGLQCSRHVIATGGSAVYGEEGMANIKQLGQVVFIDIGIEELRKRLKQDLLDRGVVIRRGTTLQELYNERLPLYRKYADKTICTDGLSTLEAVEKLAEVLGRGSHGFRRV